MTRIETRSDVSQGVSLALQNDASPEIRAQELARTAARLLAPGTQGGNGEVQAFARDLAALPQGLQERVLASVPGLGLERARAALAEGLARSQPPRPARIAPQDVLERAPSARFEGAGSIFESARGGGLPPARDDGRRVETRAGSAASDGAAVVERPLAPPTTAPALDERQLLTDALRPRRAAAVVSAAPPAPAAAAAIAVEDVLRPALRDLAQEASRAAAIAERLRAAAVAAPLPGGFATRYQAFVAAHALRDVRAAADRLSGLVAVGSLLEGPSGPGAALADAAGALASIQARVADATLALQSAGVPGSGAQAALRELPDLARSLEAAIAALSVAGGRTLLVGRLQAGASPGPADAPAAHLAASLTLEDLARVGALLGTSAALPALAWTAPVVAAVVEAGRRLGVLGPGGVDSRPLAAWALGADAATASGQAARPLTELALLALLRHGGLALERLDPAQVRLAARLASEARTLPEQLEELARVLDAFQVLARVGLPALPRDVVVRALGPQGAPRPGETVERLQARMGVASAASAAIAAGREAASVEVTRAQGTTTRPAAPVERGASLSGLGGVFRSIGKAIGGLFKGIGDAFKSFFNAFLQILPFLLTILSFIPVTAPFAMVANAALAVYTAIKTKNPLALVGAVASFVGAGAVFAASRVVGAAATTLQRVADVANSVARVMKGIAAVREGDIVGGLSAIAGGAASGMGSVAGSAASGLSRAAAVLQEVSGKIGTAYQVYQAARRGDLLGAVGVGAGLAGDLSFVGPEARAALAQVQNAALRLRGAQAAIRSGDYAGAAAAVAGLAADLTEGETRVFFARAGETLGKVAVAQKLIERKDYFGAAAEVAEAAAAYVGSTETRQALVDAAALLRRIGEAVADGLRGDYVSAAGSLAGLVGQGALDGGAPRLDDRTLVQLQKAAGVFQRAAAVWPALSGGDFRSAEALARELQALFADDPGNQVRFGQVVGFLHEAASIQDLLRRGDYPGAAARLGGLAPGFLPTADAPDVLARIASTIADQDALRRALKAGDFAQAAEIAARIFERIREESSRQTFQLGSGALDEMGAVTRALDGGDAATASRLGGDLARWLERNHAAQAAAYPSAKGLDSSRPEEVRAAVSGFAREIGRSTDDAVRQETAAASAGWVQGALRAWTYVTQAGETARDLARRFGVTVAGLFAANPQAPAGDVLPAGLPLVVPAAGPGPTHTVARGETLSAIARRHGTTVAELQRLNPAITDPDRIAVGQVLLLPAAGQTKAGTARPPQLPVQRPAAPAPQPGLWERVTQGWDAFWDRLFAPAPATAPAAPKPAADGSLVLGVNDTYRDAILLASERTGIDAAALAALVSAEAGRVRGAKLQQVTDDAFYARHPELGRRPLEKTETALVKEWREIHEAMKQAWDPSAVNSASGATGLTQFLKGTWLDQARTAGTYLNQVAREKGYVDEKNRVVAGKADELLDLRKDATLSIVAAAEYGQANLKLLDARELVPATATDDEKAKLMYLAHHEGYAGAVAVLNETLTDARAKVLLGDNVSAKTREALVKEHGSEAKAYIAWLNAYIDDHIRPGRFREAEK